MRQGPLLAAVYAVLVAAGPATAEVVFNDTLPFSFEFFNECTGEVVLVEGEFHRVVSTVEKNDGTFQVHNNLTARGFGVGLDSGAEYCWNDTILDTFVDPPGIADWEQVNEHIRLIGLGQTPNQRVVITFELETDEFGVSSFVSIVDVFCQCD